MKRTVAFLYGLLAYLLFFGTFLYLIGFVGDLLVPKTIDSGTPGSLGPALIIDVALLAVFAIQHSVMARPEFKRWWTRFVPEAVERSTYVLLASLASILLLWQWRPLSGIVWAVEQPVAANVLWALFGLGWAIVLVSTFLINHFDLFGLRQVYLYASGRPYTPLHFQMRSLYRVVRHPIMLGFVIAFWATPTMTLGHLIFAIGTTGYILVGVQLEERDLQRAHGASYTAYRRQVRMLLPIPKGAAKT